MQKIKLSSILLLALVTPFIMRFRIGSGETPFWQFGLIFLSLGLYLGLDVISIKEKKKQLFKDILLWLVIFLTVVMGVWSAMVVRHRGSPVYGVHDIVLQQEAAIRFLLDGKNPYQENYLGTFLEEWHYSETQTNPALYHFVMMPFYLIFALPFYWLSFRTIGFFDARMPLLFLFLSSLALAALLLKKRGEAKRQFLILLAFNPATLGYLIEGRSDFFVFGFLFLSLYLLFKKQKLLSAIVLGLSFAVKQSVWPIFPFYFAYLAFKAKNPKKLIKPLLGFGASFGLSVLPFLFWGPKYFLEDTILYLSGKAEHSYPIAGYGWGMVLNQLGLIQDINGYYSFLIWQLIFGLPLLFILIKWLFKKPKIWKLIFSYGIFTFVFWYFSRYFNNSHIAYLSSIFIIAFYFEQIEKRDA